MNSIIKALIELEYSKQQATIYVDLLKNGPSSLSKIAQRTEIPRSSLYDYYPKLLFEGLISETSKSGRKKFKAESPSIILKRLKNYKNNINTKIQNFENSIQGILNKYDSSNDKPRIKYYHGVKGIKIIMDQILKYNSNYNMCIGTPDKDIPLSFEHEILEWFLKEMKKRKIKTKEILENTDANRKYGNEYTAKTQKVRYCKRLPDKKTTHIDKFIVKNFVVIFDFSKEIAIQINDSNIADNEKTQFEIMWNSLPKSK